MMDSMQDTNQGLVVDNVEIPATPEADTDQAARLEKENAELKGLLLDTKAQLTELTMGVNPDRVPYVLRLASLEGIDPGLSGADEAISAAVTEVLNQIPEWTGGSAPRPIAGSLGDHRRVRGSHVYGDSDTDEARRSFAYGMR